MKMLLARLWIAAIVATVPTLADAQAPASFRFGGMRFEVPLPEGYCPVQGAEIDTAQLMAAADPRNVTHLTLVGCGPQQGLGANYIIIKTPMEGLSARMGREQFLEAISAAFREGPFNSADFQSSIADEAGRHLSTVSRTPVNLSGDIRPLGLDRVCGYMGGIMEVRSAAGNYSRSVGICMTSISDRLLNINWYGPAQGSPGVADLLLRSRQLAERITATPAP
ncbi:MAG TPA: hypothetical protein VGB79_03955 [Allosphingosinicella sp.]